MKKRILTIVLLAVALFIAPCVQAQAPIDSPEKAIEGLLTRIGGNSAPDKFEIVINENLAENGKDVFIITSQNGKPCIKGNNQLSVATGINWYLNHYAHINLTWNNLTTDLSKVTLPVPTTEEKHVSSAAYRYDFNTCTFSYSMAFWTWERWQQEIDWMALHGINAPLNLVGLDVVTLKFLRELGVSENDINAYIAGPGFIAWFAMNNLEGWGGTINSPSTGVDMSGNPNWWYTRQEQLCRNMLQRMRELGMQPVIPGFSGQVPNCIANYSIKGFDRGDIVDNGKWAGGYTRPDILKPKIKPDGSIRMRVWERGSGITQACGTGACATAFAAISTNKVQNEVLIHMDGGDLQVYWDNIDKHIYMRGTAEKVFDGVIELNE